MDAACSRSGPIPPAAACRALALLLLLICAPLAGCQALPAPADPAPLGGAQPTPTHGRRLEQAPTTLPACKSQLTASNAQLATCKTQLSTAGAASKACATKLTACAQSATAKQLSACQRRGAAYNSAAASAGTKLQGCTAARDALTKENSKLKAAAAQAAKRSAPTVAAAATADPLTTCQQQLTVLQSQLDATNASLAGAQAALTATQAELDSVNTALAQRDADVADLQEQLAAASAQLQQANEQEAELVKLRWQLSQLQKVYTVTDGMLNQTREDLDKVSATVDGLRDANASCHVDLSNQGAQLEDAQAELAACQLATSACAKEKASLHEAYLEASAKQFPPEEYVACANELITTKIANETNANAAGECQSQLSDMERSYQECMSRSRRLLKLPGGRPALARTAA